MSGKTLLVIGATSDIARATALVFAREGWDVILSGRDTAALEADVADIALRSHQRGTISARRLDILETGTFDPFLDSLDSLPDVVLCAVGLLGDQARAQADPDHARLIMRTNYEGPALLLGQIAERFVARGSGTIIGISSVAGDRGRASNYVYGSAKAGFSAFLSGLRNRCFKAGVHVMTVKPGFVRTRMTQEMDLPGPVTAEPQEVAKRIYRATTAGSNVVFSQPVWRAIMTIITAIPEPVFKRLSI